MARQRRSTLIHWVIGKLEREGFEEKAAQILSHWLGNVSSNASGLFCLSAMARLSPSTKEDSSNQI